MLIFIQLVKRLGNVERMVANALIIGQDFRIQDGSFHMTFPLSHALNLVGTVPGVRRRQQGFACQSRVVVIRQRH